MAHRTPLEEEEAQTPSQLTYEEGKDTKNRDDESCVSCNRLTVELWNGEEGVHHHMSIIASTNINETR
jgi:hypothetical protein